MDWIPETFEDRLIYKYFEDHPGNLFLEVPVGGSNDIQNARRIDAILIPNKRRKVFPQNQYTNQELKQNLGDEPIHLIEAKRVLNRNVIGQVEVGYSLFTRDFEFGNIKQIALCTSGEPDLEWYCKQKNIHVTLYQILSKKNLQDLSSLSLPKDLRKTPDTNRMKAFFQGWRDAEKGRFYESIRKQKTHQNIGNLFGWIYGNKDKEFKMETWNHYSKECTKED